MENKQYQKSENAMQFVLEGVHGENLWRTEREQNTWSLRTESRIYQHLRLNYFHRESDTPMFFREIVELLQLGN